MFKNILVPLDGSPLAEQAIGLAQSVAKASRAHITLVQVVNNFDPTMIEPYEINIDAERLAEIAQGWVEEANEYLAKVAEGIKTTAMSAVDTKVLQGDAAMAISTLAHNGYDLVVMSTHGRSGLSRTLLGSVAMTVVRDSHLPVMQLNSHQQVADYPKRDYQFHSILVPLDGSGQALQALPPAVELARVSHGRLVLLKVRAEQGEAGVYIVHEVGRTGTEDYDYVLGSTDLDDYRYLEDVAARYIPTEVSYTAIVCTGQADQDIIATQGDYHCGLIVMSTHARSGFQRLSEGSVAERVVSQAPVPVLLLRGEMLPALAQGVKSLTARASSQG
jgi:nucleotide-binding universal stress UspA family protein